MTAPTPNVVQAKKGLQGFASLGAFGASGELSVNTDIQITFGVKSLKRLGKR